MHNREELAETRFTSPTDSGSEDEPMGKDQDSVSRSSDDRPPAGRAASPSTRRSTLTARRGWPR
eukprot:5925362-Lingulodinium_polyedra.AAC.1